MEEVTARVVFCDDIRQEYNGKLILIGVYSGEIRFNPPLVQPIATWIQIFGLPAGDHKATANVTYDNGQNAVVLGTIEFHFQITDPTLPAHAFPTGLLVNFDRPGKLDVSISINDQLPFKAGSLRLSVSPDQ